MELYSSHFCMISSPSFEKPPVLISLLDPRDCWLVLGALEAREAEAGGAPSGATAWLFALRWLAATEGAAPLLLWAMDGGLEAWLAWLRGIAGGWAASTGL